ncbi:MAG: (Fe-S)-binding protein [Desulfosarcina sp.]|nr:(Fe-S)-binding protein [Desulfobacterales bacterium]
MDIGEKRERLEIKNKDELLEELSKCRRCRFCLDACEIYQQSENSEVMSGYGRVQLLRLLLDNTVQLDDAVVYPIYSCLQCGRCTIVCKSKGQNLEVSELIRIGRSLLAKELARQKGK